MKTITYGSLRQLSFEVGSDIALKEVRVAVPADRDMYMPWASPAAFRDIVIGIAVSASRDRYGDSVITPAVHWLIDDGVADQGQRWVTTMGLPLAILGGINGLELQHESLDNPDVIAECLRIHDDGSAGGGFGNKIAAIKFLRSKSRSLGLKDAKDMLEGLVAQRERRETTSKVPGLDVGLDVPWQESGC